MTTEKVEMIDICKIMVSNPRDRDVFTHNEIKENINQIGLKRPITVRRMVHDHFEYALICGQGRLEAYQEYKETMIPAIVKNVDEETGHLMSLAENIARRKPRAGELLGCVRQLKMQGLTDKEIGYRLGYTTSWVHGVMNLIERGEKKLLIAFESGYIPLYLAVEISRADDNETQKSLTEALLNGQIKGNQINRIKRILDRRKEGSKGAINNTYTNGRPQKKLSPEELSKIYQKNVNEHKDILVKSNYVNETILAVKEIFKQLIEDDDFCSVLRNNNITNMPEALLDKNFNRDKNYD
ncbi:MULTISPECIES: ParB/RepB/Spo0J family partition protein [Yersinia]|uniref:ParB family protein n=3 Tax=Yersinia TaxID=629 RepID=A0A0T9RHX7_9GAMM|nr:MULTISPECIES: ParB N-terminal domain-containing protein [Yersinia]AJJ06692.1 parB-like nuclease domain protein [Yersinia pseudotuberculosis]MBO1556106.1 chromosome partitioning protein ParB [Yersinia pseudotuberculosis]MBO1563470.1 chromosome partitioning protein ParB [Yersinia pseudotuberculosis]MBO1631967.1 ParB N-terminal domain-containing protein [Yersinia pseudotuberculosis]MBP0069850.1 chromosome partitioning protein ParB [Yersinia pseudotuberculosis]